MSSDDSFRNPQYSSNRKTNNKSLGYSPSANYNFNSNQTMHSNHNNNNHGNHSNHGNNGNYGNQQQRRKSTNFKPRDNHGSNDRIVKQNDIIIRLLKEIRDRLPPNPSAPSYEKQDTAKSRKYSGKHSSNKQEQGETESAVQKKVTGNEKPVEKTPAEVEMVQEDMFSDASESEPVGAEFEKLDNAVNGNVK